MEVNDLRETVRCVAEFGARGLKFAFVELFCGVSGSSD